MKRLLRITSHSKWLNSDERKKWEADTLSTFLFDWSPVSCSDGSYAPWFQSIEEFYYSIMARWGALLLKASVQVQYLSYCITGKAVQLSLCGTTHLFSAAGLQIEAQSPAQQIALNIIAWNRAPAVSALWFTMPNMELHYTLINLMAGWNNYKARGISDGR